MIRRYFTDKRFTPMDLQVAMIVGALLATHQWVSALFVGIVIGGVISTYLQLLLSKKEGA